MTLNRSRRPLQALAAASAVLALAACGGSDPGTEGGGGGDEGPVELRFAGWDESQTPAMQAFIDAFEAENENISVTYETVPFNQYATKLQVQASSGDAPDVFWLHANDRDLYASEGVTQNLDELIEESDFDLSAYPDAALQQVTYDDSIYGFPRGAATVELWFNKEMFDAKGVEYPTADWTWEDLQTAAAALTDTPNGVYGVTTLYDGTQSFYNTIFQAGGQVISDDRTEALLDQPEAIEGIEFWTDMIEAGSAPTYQAQLDTAPAAMFQSGKAAMIYAGSWHPGIFDADAAIKDKIDVVQMPAGPGGDATLLGANAYAMSSNSEHPEAAWKFLSFIGGPDGAKVGAQSKVVVQPAEKDAAVVWAEQFPQWNMAAITDSAADGVPGPTTKLTTEWTGAMVDALAPAFDLKVPAAEAAKNADAAIEEVLAKENG
ncbi:sugar ABC transporter substrate-binding protein [Angustibacter speluncae]